MNTAAGVFGVPKYDRQCFRQWEIFLWDVELQETKLLGIVDVTSPYMAVGKAISLFHIESAAQRERLIAVRRALSAISWDCTRVDEAQW